MNKLLYFNKKIILTITFFHLLIGLHTQQETTLPTITKNNIQYFSINQFVNENNLKSTYYQAKNKIEIIYEGYKFYFSPQSSFFKINTKIYNLTHPTLLINNNIYIPLKPFYKILKTTTIPLKITNIQKNNIVFETNKYDIIDFFIENKSNGLELVINSNKKFHKDNIATSINSNGWLNITILNSLIDSINFKNSHIVYPIVKANCIQQNNSSQLSFLIKKKVDDIIVIPNKNSINILLSTDQSSHANKINKMRKQFLLDTIVIDAGHGGKDPGAVGNHLKEKNITLDVAKQLGAMLERTPGLKVIYTRDEDVFVPLWKRTQIANNVNGDLFLSLHVNSTNHKNVKGYETYLLRVGKINEAIEVAKRENGVIALENQTHQYKNFDNEELIVATMAQNANLKSSETLASLIQTNLEKNINSKNRGVKQAGFHVLVGASMPNVLIEVGFLSNKEEAKKLGKAQYRRLLAKSIYQAIMEYKNKNE